MRRVNNQNCIFFESEKISYVQQTAKKQAATENQAVQHPLVSERQELHKQTKSQGQTSADAAPYGPQTRMAKMTIS